MDCGQTDTHLLSTKIWINFLTMASSSTLEQSELPVKLVWFVLQELVGYDPCEAEDYITFIGPFTTLEDDSNARRIGVRTLCSPHGIEDDGLAGLNDLITCKEKVHKMVKRRNVSEGIETNKHFLLKVYWASNDVVLERLQAIGNSDSRADIIYSVQLWSSENKLLKNQNQSLASALNTRWKNKQLHFPMAGDIGTCMTISEAKEYGEHLLQPSNCTWHWDWEYDEAGGALVCGGGDLENQPFKVVIIQAHGVWKYLRERVPMPHWIIKAHSSDEA